MDYDSVYKLGQKIAEELGYSESVDTLGKWMSQYIAELIVKAEADDCDNSIKQECAEEILKIWSYRKTLPNGKRPFESFERIFYTLDSLSDKQRPHYRYFNNLQHKATEEQQPDEIQKYLQTAEGLDLAARMLIKIYLSNAAKLAMDDSSKDWVTLASQLSEDKEEVDVISRLILGTDDEDESKKKKTQKIKEIDEKINKIKAFKEMSSILISELEKSKSEIEK